MTVAVVLLVVLPFAAAAVLHEAWYDLDFRPSTAVAMLITVAVGTTGAWMLPVSSTTKFIVGAVHGLIVVAFFQFIALAAACSLGNCI